MILICISSIVFRDRTNCDTLTQALRSGVLSKPACAITKSVSSLVASPSRYWGDCWTKAITRASTPCSLAQRSQSSAVGANSYRLNLDTRAGSRSVNWYSSPSLTAEMTTLPGGSCLPARVLFSANSCTDCRISGRARFNSSKKSTIGWPSSGHQ